MYTTNAGMGNMAEATATTTGATTTAGAAGADMNLHDLTQTLVESFNALADEVQNLNDRQTILEHKLRFAHEQVTTNNNNPHILHHLLLFYVHGYDGCTYK